LDLDTEDLLPHGNRWHSLWLVVITTFLTTPAVDLVEFRDDRVKGILHPAVIMETALIGVFSRSTLPSSFLWKRR